MRNLVLAIVLFFVCSLVNAQKMNKDFLEGNWETEFHNVEFKIIDKKELRITMSLKETNEPIDVVSYQFNKNNLYIETYYSVNNWEAIGKLIIVDNNTMVEDCISDAPGLLTYKRKKINN